MPEYRRNLGQFLARLRGTQRWLILSAIAAAVYLPLAYVGYVAATSVHASVWWPAGGFAMAMLLLFGRACLPGVALASVLASTFFAPSPSLLNTLAMLLSALAAPITTSFVLQRLRVRNAEFEQSVAGRTWFGAATYAGSLAGALAQCVVLALVQGWNADWFWNDLATWTMGYALGVLSITPLLMAGEHRHASVRARAWSVAEAALIVVLIVALAWATFVTGARWLPDGYLQSYLLVPLLFLAVMRLPTRWVLSLMLMCTVFWLVGVQRGSHPIGSGDRDIGLWLMHGFMLITYAGLLLLTALIHERRVVVNELHSREAHYRALAALSSDGYWELDAQFRVKNNSGINAWGAQDAGNLLLTATPLDGESKGTRAVRAAMQAKLPFRDLILRQQDGPGQVRYLRMSGEPVLDSSGLFVGYRGVSTDVTNELQAQRALRRSESELRALIDSLPDVVVLMDAQGHWRLANRAVVQMWSLEQIDWQGKTTQEVVSLLPIKYSGEIFASEQEAERLAQGKVIRLEQMLPQLDDAPRTYDLILTPMQDDEGVYAGTVVIARDITHLKQSERIRRQQLDEIQRLNAELETRVKIRTAALEAANRELEAFSYSVSHDLRAPLRSLDGFSRMLVEDYGNQLDATGIDYLQRIRRNSQRMGELIDDLLKLSRVARAEVRRQLVNLSSMATDIMNEMADADPDRKVEIVVSSGLWVDADPGLVRALLENLLRNAWKFTRKEASARIEFVGVERNHVSMFAVRDNGVGFDMAYAARLFSPFQRLHAGTDYEGSGIGLAIVQRIVRLHGGTVFAESKPGEGAAFYFSLG